MNVPLDSIEGIHDIIFVAKDRRHGVLNLDWFELLETFLFKFTSNYRVDDNPVNARDVQCAYNVVKESFVNQIFDRYFADGDDNHEKVFFDHLGASDENDARNIVSEMCVSAQNGIEEHSFDDIAY